MQVEIINELPRSSTGARACVVRREDGRYFLVSSVTAADTGKFETLAFACDVVGTIEDWATEAGGIGRSRDETIAQLAADKLGSNIDEWLEESGGVSEAFASTFLMARDAVLGTMPYDSSDRV